MDVHVLVRDTLTYTVLASVHCGVKAHSHHPPDYDMNNNNNNNNRRCTYDQIFDEDDEDAAAEYEWVERRSRRQTTYEYRGTALTPAQVIDRDTYYAYAVCNHCIRAGYASLPPCSSSSSAIHYCDDGFSHAQYYCCYAWEDGVNKESCSRFDNDTPACDNTLVFTTTTRAATSYRQHCNNNPGWWPILHNGKNGMRIPIIHYLCSIINEIT